MICQFWPQYPGLLYGITVLISVAALFSSTTAIILFMLLVCSLLLSGDYTRLLLVIALTSASFFLANSKYQFPELPKEGVEGIAHFEISSITAKKTFFGKKWIYRGMLAKLEGDAYQGERIPCSVSFPCTSEYTHPPANRSYLIKGKLKQTEAGNYNFHVNKHTPWQPVQGSFSLAEWRYDMKKKVINHIHNAYPQKEVATFLAGIATGEFDDAVMQQDFSRFGLQHIMAISGFHFSIIAAIFGFLLRFFCGPRITTGLLVFLLTTYFIFLGCGASIMRAWAACLLGLLALFVEKRHSGLNSLGLGLVFVLIIDPIQVKNLGFQFTFTTTAAILMFYPHCDQFLKTLFPKRALGLMIQMNSWHQHAYCLLGFFRSAIALSIAVNMVALPLTFFHFNQFPLWSLVYNLFFPFMVGISIFFLILGVLAGWIFPSLGALFHTINGFLTAFVLDFTSNLPKSLDLTFKFTFYSYPALISTFIIIFIYWIIKDYNNKNKLFNN